MGEQTWIQIQKSRISTVMDAVSRRFAMSESLKREWKNLENSMIDIPAHKTMFSESATQSSLGKQVSTLSAEKSSSIPNSHQQIHWDNAMQTVSMLNALAIAPELKPLHAAVIAEIPMANQLAESLTPILLNRQNAALTAKSLEISTALDKVIQVVQKEHKRLAKEELKSTVGTLEESLSEIGFDQIRSKETKDGKTVIRASQASAVSVYAEVSAEGSIKVDTVGIEGKACRKTVEALLEKLREKGIEAVQKESIYHGAEGGELVKEVAPIFDLLAPQKPECRKGFGDHEKRRKALTYARKLKVQRG